MLPDIKENALKRVAIAALAGVDDAEAASHAPPGIERSAGPRAASAARAPKLAGELYGAAWGLVVRLLAAVTGILLLKWLFGLLSRYVLGLKRTGTVTLTASTVTVEHELHLLGRTVREGTTSYALRSLRSGGVERRFRYLHLLVGALALVIGAGFGINFLVEGACSSYPPLALLGVAIIGGGILLDVLLEVLVPNKKGVCTVSLDFGRRKHVRLQGVKQELADQFAKELELLVPQPKKR